MRVVALGALVLLAAGFAIAIGGESGSLTVTNLTPHVVRVVVADKTFPTVAPGAGATYRSSAGGAVTARVSYVPGQGVGGSAERSFQLPAPGPASSSGTAMYWSCRSGSGITSPADAGPLVWRVTADTLAVR